MSGRTPIPVAWDREFWAYAGRGLLSAQRCHDCGWLQHYPKPVCGACLSEALVFEPLSGRGRIYSFTTVRRPGDPSFLDQAPFTMLDVALDEGIRIISRLADERDADHIAIGNEVHVVFVPTASGTPLPYFTKHSPRRSQ